MVCLGYLIGSAAFVGADVGIAVYVHTLAALELNSGRYANPVLTVRVPVVPYRFDILAHVFYFGYSINLPPFVSGIFHHYICYRDHSSMHHQSYKN